jgi:hypothetical protein
VGVSIQEPRSEIQPSPRQEYTQRRDERSRQAAELARREALVGNARVVVFVVGVGMAGLAFAWHWFSLWWLLVPGLLFSVLLVRHERVVRRWWRARRAVAFYEQGLARCENRWQGKGEAGARFLDEHHPCSADLDLFGPASLFELLCTARTRTGEDTLARWLLAGAPPDEIRARQEAIAELRSQLDLREDLALLGSDVPTGIDFDTVIHWGSAPPLLQPHGWRWPLLVLGILSVGSLLGWQLSLWEVIDHDSPIAQFFLLVGSLPFVVIALIQLCAAGLLFKRVRRVLSSIEKRARDLSMLARVLDRLEKAPFSSPRLAQLHAILQTVEGRSPAQAIAQLSNLIDLLESRRNQLFAPFALLLMWTTQMAYAIEHWRLAAGSRIRAWLGAVGEFEALCALATYAYENPDDPFPEIRTDPGDLPVYEAEGLGHPLLPVTRCVRNDLRLSRDLRVFVVSGSNMSGKSTWLRTVGINAVLALAGAPVRARRMRICPLAIGATLRIQDSLQAGCSRFQAEVLRVRQVVELSRGPLPLLFLLDEIFAGTNSHDRRLGAEAILLGLVEAGAIGLVTTHDLSLTRIVDQLGTRAANVHFADHLEDGQMKFDYRLHEGVVQHSNALALMRAVGLRV